MPFNFRFVFITRYAGGRLPAALPELYTRLLHPAIHEEVLSMNLKETCFNLSNAPN